MDIDKVIKYENGEMLEQEIIDFFQELVDAGTAWELQGSYGRMALHLIKSGLISINKTSNKKTSNLRD
jgi:hypothetical protein|tara:strand:- start:3895 stop:4098 length:204 start_codon:yes stop_codon:yes gene_type:complete